MKKDTKKLFRNFVAKLLICVLVIASVTVSPGTLTKAATKSPEISKSVDILKNQKYEFKVKNEITNSTYEWTSSNKKIATVSSEGVVTGIKKGTAEITCVVKESKVSYYLSSKVTVREAASAVKISNKVTLLNQGQTYDLNRTLTPASSNDKITWTSSDTSIAKPNSWGKFTALKKGKVTVTAKTLSGKKDSVTFEVIDADGLVTNQEGLNKLLSSGASQITLKTDDAVNLTISEENYKKQNLVVDAPNADVTNNGVFQSVTIKQIKANTWYEQAVGNIINVSAASARVVIGENAVASINVTNANTNLNLVNNGTVNELHLSAAATINISGSSTAVLSVIADSEGASITSSIPLSITCTQRINLTILPGAEATVIHVASEDLIPVITGSTSINVVIGSGTEARTVSVRPTVNTGSSSSSSSHSSGNSGNSGNNGSGEDNGDGGDDGNNENPEEPVQPITASISGRVTTVTGSSIEVDGDMVVSGSAVSYETLSGVTVRMLKYEGDVSGILAGIFTNPNTIVTATDENGYYLVDDLEAGNYVVVFSKEGYKVLVQLATVVENSPTTVNGTLIQLLNEDETLDGIATGSIIDALTGEVVDESLEFTVEIYQNFNSTSELVDTVVASGAAFSFSLPEGYYTVKLIDNRTPEIGVTYTATTRNIIVLGGTTFTDQDIVMATLKAEGQATFVLTWGEYPVDLDSHLIGPVEGEDNYHIYFANKTYPTDTENIEELDLRLDVDDITSYGPETTSIYHSVEGGIYTYYVFNYSSNYNGEGTLANSGAKVVVTTSEGTHTFEVPAGDDTKTSWIVCTYNSATGEVIPINQLVEGDYYYTYINQIEE